jgi:hypothetical protein
VICFAKIQIFSLKISFFKQKPFCAFLAQSKSLSVAGRIGICAIGIEAEERLRVILGHEKHKTQSSR